MPEAELPTFIVSGTRHATVEQHLDAIKRGIRDITWMIYPNGMQFHLVHGAAKGVDVISGGWVQGYFKLPWKVTPVPAQWKLCGDDCPPRPHRKTNRFGEYCPLAGGRRNQQMLDQYPGAPVLSFPAIGGPEPVREQSSGSWDMLERAVAAGREVVVRPLYVPRGLW